MTTIPTLPEGAPTPPESRPTWPDALRKPESADVAALLEAFWLEIETLPALLAEDEMILAEALTARLRRIVMELMLAMNGIAWPEGTTHLNGYLGNSQRMVLERTLRAPNASAETWLARAVALTVIYRWYAPQCAERFGVAHPDTTEARVWAALYTGIPGWPQTLTTEPDPNPKPE
jgi:hypothetical protein